MMYEKEKVREAHLIVLIVCTIMIVALTGEAYLLGWETGAIVLLLLGLAASWFIHIKEKASETVRLWLYFILSMLAVFFYGSHETSIFDLAPLMLVIILLFSVVEKYSIIRLCVITYFLTMGYDFVFVLGDSLELTPLFITRTLLHVVLILVAGYLVKLAMYRRKKENQIIEKRITELEETNRRTEDFLTNVSHELRTPINAVTGITTVMLKKEDDEEKRKDILAVQNAGHRLFEQIEDILDYTEIDTGRIRVSEDTYMISSIVNDIIMGIPQSESDDKPELIFDIDGSMPSVLLGDGRKIKNILKHLIDNSYKFTPKGGIYVRVYALQKDYGVNLCIKISDTGVGITEEELDKITERFYQTNGGRNRRAGGLGLGLPIVYGMVNAMEGFIQMESTVGKGTSVYISIPQRVADPAPGMVVDHREKLCLGCFLKPEKYEIPEVRNYYDEVISHMVHELDIPLHRLASLDELKKLNSLYQLTHLFIGDKEYAEEEAYFEELSHSMEVIVVAEYGFELPQGSRIKLLQKPFYCLPAVNVLNADVSENEKNLQENHMICPGVRVLVVDDEPMNLMVAEGILRDYQMDITTASSGVKAIELCKETDFDLVLLDHMMPEMDGVETLKWLRKIHKDSDKVLTVIAFTANAVSGAREMFREEGFDEFVSKPIELNELERVLRKVLPKTSIKYEVIQVKKAKKQNAYTKKNVENETKKGMEEETGSEQTHKLDSQDNLITCLGRIGLNTGAALQYSLDDEKFYLKLLHEFTDAYVTKRQEMDKHYQQSDFYNYRIQVHALKSSARLIGADTLSEMAKNMEEAANNLDGVYMQEHHMELLTKYCEVKEQIQEVIAPGEREAKKPLTEVPKEVLLGKLKQLKKSLDSYDIDQAEAMILEMSDMEYQGKSVGTLLQDVGQDVEEFEYTAAAERVEALLGSVEGGDV